MRIGRDEFAQLVTAALREVPEALRRYVDDVTVDVEQHPDAETCREAEIDDPSELLGFYRGTPFGERGQEEVGPVWNRITIYQRNIERVCRTRDEVVEQVRVTVFHELGHHFGLDEDDLAALGFD